RDPVRRRPADGDGRRALRRLSRAAARHPR
ncbi:acyl-CoA dehydrogenase, partial [Stenotrophomonas maltophilia]